MTSAAADVISVPSVRNAEETDTDEAQLHQSHIVQGLASEFTWFSRVLYSGRMFRKGNTDNTDDILKKKRII